MEVLLDDVVAHPLQGEELEGHIHLTGEFLLQDGQLIRQEAAVGTERVGELDDLDRSVREALGGLGSPEGRDEAGVVDQGKTVELVDYPTSHTTGLGVFLGRVEEGEAVGAHQEHDRIGGQVLQGGPEEAGAESGLTLIDSVHPEEDE